MLRQTDIETTTDPRGSTSFMAVLAGLAMLIGQSLNTLGTVQIYKHEEIDAVGRYRPATVLRAAS